MTAFARSRIRRGCVRQPDLSIQSLTHSNAVVKLSDFGSLRIRGGYVMGCFLPYVFAGTGLGSQTVDRTVSCLVSDTPLLPATTRRQQDQAGLRLHAPASAST